MTTVDIDRSPLSADKKDMLVVNSIGHNDRGRIALHIKLLYACQAITLVCCVLLAALLWRHQQQLSTTGAAVANDKQQYVVLDAALQRMKRQEVNMGALPPVAYEYLLPTDGEQDDNWVLLPSYARVSLQALKEVCVSSLNYCGRVLENYNRPIAGPRGPQGPQGLPGECGCSDDGWTGKKKNDSKTSSDNVEEIKNSSTVSPPKKTSNTRVRLGIQREKCFLTNTSEPRVILGVRKRLVFNGGWMRDSAPVPTDDTDEAATRPIYLAEGFMDQQNLYEYVNMSSLQANDANRTLTLPHEFYGTNHLVYRGAFFFHRRGMAQIVRYDLQTLASIETELPGAEVSDNNYLYSKNATSGYLDFASDENGLWVIYRKANRKYAVVSRIDPTTLKIMGTKRLKHLKPHRIGNSFVICGVLYTVESSWKRHTTIGWAFDLYQRQSAAQPLKVNLPWENLKGHSVMVNYNPADKTIYVYDNGYLINVDVQLHY